MRNVPFSKESANAFVTTELTAHDAGETGVAPLRPPGILYDEVFFVLRSDLRPKKLNQSIVLVGALDSVSNDEHRVSRVRAARQPVDDAASIADEEERVGVDADSDWPALQGGLQLLGAVRHELKVCLALDRPSHVQRSLVPDLATLLLCHIGVVFTLDDRLRLAILVCIVDVAALAAEVARVAGAVNQLLHGEVDQIARLDRMLALEGASGCDGPAAAAIALEEWRFTDDTFLTPVERLWKIVDLE